MPTKKPKGGALSAAVKAMNRELLGERIGLEHVNRRFEIFRILTERYRIELRSAKSV